MLHKRHTSHKPSSFCLLMMAAEPPPSMEDHTNTEDYIHGGNSPTTNRRNAGILLRRMSDSFNERRYPGLRERARSASEAPDARWRVAIHAISFLRRLRSAGDSPESAAATAAGDRDT